VNDVRGRRHVARELMQEADPAVDVAEIAGILQALADGEDVSAAARRDERSDRGKCGDGRSRRSPRP
jgi:hypothetical protein